MDFNEVTATRVPLARKLILLQAREGSAGEQEHHKGTLHNYCSNSCCQINGLYGTATLPH